LGLIWLVPAAGVFAAVIAAYLLAGAQKSLSWNSENALHRGKIYEIAWSSLNRQYTIGGIT
jgi:hypothetical protein